MPAVTRKAEITITERKGENFKGRILYQGARVPSSIEGTAANGVVNWDVTVKGKAGLHHKGEVKDKRMEVQFGGPDSDSPEQEEKLSLEYVSAVRR